MKKTNLAILKKGKTKDSLVEVLAYSMLMNKEVEGMAYLRKILPKIAHEWIEYKKFDI